MSFIKLPSLSNGLTVRHEDILPDETIVKRIDLTRNLMQKLNIDTLLIYRDGAINGPVCYLTNYPSYRIGRRALVVLSLNAGPFLYSSDPSRNVPRVRRFTSCDLEGSRKFFSAGCRQAKKLAEGRIVGLVGTERLSKELSEEMEKELSGLKVKLVSESFYAHMANKDDSSLNAVKIASDLAGQGMSILEEQIDSDKDLWKLAAYIDYRLRLLGCEDTNILLGCASKGKIRPGYPDRTQPKPGDTLIAYIAVRYARHWGALGRTLSIASANEILNEKLALLTDVQKSIASRISADMKLVQVENVIRAAGQEKGMVFATDMPVVSGIGFDISEYPLGATDRVVKNAVLQVVLAEDSEVEEQTVWRLDMLHVAETGGSWLSAQA